MSRRDFWFFATLVVGFVWGLMYGPAVAAPFFAAAAIIGYLEAPRDTD